MLQGGGCCHARCQAAQHLKSHLQEDVIPAGTRNRVVPAPVSAACTALFMCGLLAAGAPHMCCFCASCCDRPTACLAWCYGRTVKRRCGAGIAVVVVVHQSPTFPMGVMADSAVLLVRSMAPWITATSCVLSAPPSPAATNTQAGAQAHTDAPVKLKTTSGKHLTGWHFNNQQQQSTATQEAFECLRS